MVVDVAKGNHYLKAKSIQVNSHCNKQAKKKKTYLSMYAHERRAEKKVNAKELSSPKSSHGKPLDYADSNHFNDQNYLGCVKKTCSKFRKAGEGLAQHFM